MNDNLTPWFPGTVKPVRPGVYQREALSGSLPFVYAEWTGHQWLCATLTLRKAAKQTVASWDQSRPWRGLASKP